MIIKLNNFLKKYFLKKVNEDDIDKLKKISKKFNLEILHGRFLTFF
jgi:hypothetical protein